MLNIQVTIDPGLVNAIASVVTAIAAVIALRRRRK